MRDGLTAGGGERSAPIAVLGGGISGLGVGFYLARHGLPFELFEASDEIGGNARTFVSGGFRYDSGAHRLHDKDAEVTRDLQELLGDELRPVEIPSHIHDGGRWIDFPLSPLNLAARLSPRTLFRATFDLLAARALDRSSPGDFEQLAVSRYGRTLAERFLLNYSRKLWGVSADQLSVGVSGGRLAQLNLLSFVKEAILGSRAKTRHLDGRFLYPRRGIGSVAEALARGCGPDSIRCGSRVTRLIHDGRRIRSVEINGSRRLQIERVVATLPVPLLVRLLEPGLSPEVLEAASRLDYRKMRVVTVFVNRERLTRSGTVYFPSAALFFTRITEPKNRSPEMAPRGQTSLCVEVPCAAGEELWELPDEALIERVVDTLCSGLGWMKRGEVLGAETRRLSEAYPILSVGAETTLERLRGELSRFENLRVIGRNAEFFHGSIHQLLRQARDLAEEWSLVRAG